MMSNRSLGISYCPHQSFELLPFFTNGVFTTVFVLLGIIGIACTSPATLKKSRRTRLGKYLLAMYLWDVSLLLSAFGFYAFTVIVAGKKLWTGAFVYLYIIFNPISQFTLVGTIWIVVAISVERYLALSQPLQHRARGTTGVNFICITIGVFSFLFSVPTVLELTIENCIEYSVNITNDSLFTTNVLAATPLRMMKVWQYGYRVGCFGLFVSPLPFIMVLVLNVKTLCIPKDATLQMGRKSIPGRSVRGSATTIRFRQEVFDDLYLHKADWGKLHFQHLGKRETKIAFLLSGMMFKFLLCYILATVVNVAEVLNPTFGYTDLFADMVDISNLLVVIQSATNWLWFVPCQRKKRKTPDICLRSNDPRRLSSVSMLQNSSLLMNSKASTGSRLAALPPARRHSDVLQVHVDSITRCGSQESVTDNQHKPICGRKNSYSSDNLCRQEDMSFLST